MCCVGDLYGALGSPVRVCRTVVVGRRRELVQRVLYVLSYFIRCSDLQENTLPQAQADCPANPCPSSTNPAPCSDWTDEKPPACQSEAGKSAPNPERTNEKTLTADSNSTDPASCSEGNGPGAGVSESADSSPFSETASDGLECAQECSGETGLEYVLANPSPPVHRARFVIGSPKEAENDGQCRPGCGRGLHRKMPSRLLTDCLDSSDDEELAYRQTCTENEMQRHELPLPRYPNTHTQSCLRRLDFQYVIIQTIQVLVVLVS